MSRRPLLLDLFCGAGGASMGYHHAGFDVVGVDIAEQRNYPFDFIRSDALEYVRRHGHEFAAIHASPPCQRYSRMSNCRNGLAGSYPDLIALTRKLLQRSGLPYVIENVEGAPLMAPVTLCGLMFGYELYRHRLFETNFALPQPAEREHTMPASRAGHWVPGTVMSVAGHVAPVAKAREIMDMNWSTREELTEAIPPYYAKYVGGHLMRALSR